MDLFHIVIDILECLRFNQQNSDGRAVPVVWHFAVLPDFTNDMGTIPSSYSTQQQSEHPR
jgi:hypothetical protein